MGKARHNFKQRIFDFTDYITLTGAIPTLIDQTDGTFPPYKIVQSSHVVRHTPRYTDEAIALVRSLRDFEAMIYPAPPDHKWCSCCGQWVHKRGFSPKADTRDGLHPHCKQCRAEHARKIYYSQKNTAQQAA